MIRGVIFDFDGLVMDTEMPDYQAWCEVYDQYDAELPMEEWMKCVGTYAEAFDACEYLEAAIGRSLEDRKGIQDAVHRRRLEIIAAQQVLPGVENYLSEARRLGLKIAVASSSTHTWVDAHLERLGLLDTFDCVRCREDVEVIKPDPALYLAALDGLGLTADEAFALEDSASGVLAAKRAGLYCVAVPNTVTRLMDLSHADRIIDSMAGVPFEDLLASLPV
ncbi:HAD family hydrolase [Aggregatilinea lenta]|uniref:HAD family hydrolase n=1 Tax=Aggregatilinea lenta TaxID=913108 RepID=UPI000E5AB95A|nr:HAD-IA family hydrolase [Aggregatilinea lenta]